MAWAVAFVVGYPALYLTAMLPVPIGVAAAITLVNLAEAQAPRRAPGMFTALRRAQLDSIHRTLIRDAALLLLAVRLDHFTAATLGALGVGPPIRRFANPTGARDAAQLARDSGRRDPADFAELATWEHQRERLEWEQADWWAHRTVTGASPDLISCCNQADLLISDILAVVSDFVASGKPYLMANLTGLAEDEFRET